MNLLQLSAWYDLYTILLLCVGVKTQSVMEAGHKPDTPATHHKPDTPASASTYDSLATMYNNVNNVVFPPTPPLPPIAGDIPNN